MYEQGTRHHTWCESAYTRIELYDSHSTDRWKNDMRKAEVWARCESDNEQWEISEERSYIHEQRDYTCAGKTSRWNGGKFYFDHMK